jgi:hypothetical protein
MSYQAAKRRILTSAINVWDGPEAVVPVTPPEAYSSPAVNGTTVIGVYDDTELRALLGVAWDGIITDVVLTGPDYDNATYLTIASTDSDWIRVRYWSLTLHSAVCHYSWMFGGNGATFQPYVRGIHWDIDDIAKLQLLGGVQAVLYFWGQRANTATVLDCLIEGNEIAPTGMVFTASSGFNSLEAATVARVQIRDCLEFGVLTSASNPESIITLPTFTDIDIEGVHHVGSARGDSLGASESGIVANQAIIATRIRAYDCGSSGFVVAGGADGGFIYDLDSDYIGSAAYSLIFEEQATAVLYFENGFNWTVDGVYSGLHTKVDVNVEWDHDGPTRNSGHVITNVTSFSFRAGVFVDDGCLDISVDRAEISRAWREGIGVHPDAELNLGTLVRYNLEPDAVYTDKPYVGIAGLWDEDPPDGWRMHPDQYYGKLVAEDQPSAVFAGYGDLYTGDINDLADDLVIGGAGDMTVASNHAYRATTDAFAIAGAKTVIIGVDMSNASTGWLFRQRRSTGETIQAIQMNPIAGPPTGITMRYSAAGFTNWTPPTAWPLTWGRDKVLIAWVIDADGVTSRVHFANLTTQKSDNWFATTPALVVGTGENMIVGNETQFAGPTNEYSDPLWLFQVYDDALEVGDIARILDDYMRYDSNRLEAQTNFSELASGWTMLDTTPTSSPTAAINGSGEIELDIAAGGANGSWADSRNDAMVYYKPVRGPFDARIRCRVWNSARTGEPDLTQDRWAAFMATDPSNVANTLMNYLYVALGADSAHTGSRRIGWATADDDGVGSSDILAHESIDAGPTLLRDLRIVRSTTDKDVFTLYYRSSSVSDDLSDGVGWGLLETIDRSDNSIPDRALYGSTQDSAIALPDEIWLGPSLSSSQVAHDIAMDVIGAYIKRS